MVAAKDDAHSDELFEFSGNQVLKAAIVYGANGSGKTNFVDAISFVKNLVCNSIHFQPGEGILNFPHKLEGYDKESSYLIQFVTDDIRFAYGFTLKMMAVTEEYLYYYPNGRQATIFERFDSKFTAGRSFRGKFNTCKDVLKENRLLLSCAANFSSVDIIEKVYRFFSDELVIYSPKNQGNWMNYSLYQLRTDEEMKAAVLRMLKNFGTGIKDINVKIDERKLEASALPPFLSEEFKKELLQSKVDAITAQAIYEPFSVDLMLEESNGVKKLVAMICPLIDIIKKGKVLICDEIDSGFHESLVYELIKQFVGYETRPLAQLIVTTHETGLLDLDLFRRDQIWFVEMQNEDRSSKMYSLIEIKNVRKDENACRGYIAGKYGAIPMLNLNFARDI